MIISVQAQKDDDQRCKVSGIMESKSTSTGAKIVYVLEWCKGIRHQAAVLTEVVDGDSFFWCKSSPGKVKLSQEVTKEVKVQKSASS